MSTIQIYKSYSFITKDPVIDELRTILKDQSLLSGKGYEELSKRGACKPGTYRNWFNGTTSPAAIRQHPGNGPRNRLSLQAKSRKRTNILTQITFDNSAALYISLIQAQSSNDWKSSGDELGNKDFKVHSEHLPLERTGLSAEHHSEVRNRESDSEREAFGADDGGSLAAAGLR